jgi:hypothetical protein
MPSLILPCLVKVGSGIAINTAEEAGVIHADVPANDASARFSLGGIFSAGHLQSKNFLYVSIIYAFAVPDTAI